MPYFEIDKYNNEFEKEINNAFWRYYNEVTNYKEVFENNLSEMSDNFRGYGKLNQFNKNYHYFECTLGTKDNPKKSSHRYRTQIIAALLEREFDLDFEVHHYSQAKDQQNKYDDKKVYIIFGNDKLEVKNIHQRFHSFPINLSKRVRGEIK